jgi:hypothetical protein
MFTRLALMFFMATLLIPGITHAEEPGDTIGTISVSGRVKEGFPPDRVKLVFEVETQGKKVPKAVAENNEKIETILRSLRSLSASDPDLIIKTSAYTVAPVYEYKKLQNERVLTGYRVDNQITIETKEVERAGWILARALENGANRVQGVTHSLSEYEGFCKELLTEAASKAKREADIVALALGEKAGKIKSVSSSCSSSNPRPPIIVREMRIAKKADSPDVPVKAGEVTVDATVNAVFWVGE